ncbi:MAG: agmatinase [Thermoplasmata archaeon]|nr:MAG: agmatinase [Thermoplasmata archaeon]
MSFLFVSPPTFARRETDIKEAKYVVIGIPFDSSQSYRVGSRYAPSFIREASRELEDYDILEDVDLTQLKIADIGNIEVSHGDFKETSKRVIETIKEVVNENRIPVILGGEHTITSMVVQSFERKVKFVCFDAHLDFREEYLGNMYSHACTLRRVGESIGFENMMVIGVRSALKEEFEEAIGKGVRIVRVDETKSNLKNTIEDFTRNKDIYLSIDMDCFDPREAPGVCNPEPQGLSFTDIVDALDFLDNCNLIGFDIVEVCPLYDTYTPVLAAKLIFKILAKNDKIWKTSQSK